MRSFSGERKQFVRLLAGVQKRLTPLILAATACLGGCSLADNMVLSVPERGTTMNVGVANMREDLLLLNIVRSSHFEPMSFSTLSKYNATGQLQLQAQNTQNGGLLYDITNKGNVAAGTTVTTAFLKSISVISPQVQQGGNFDLNPLETQEFYSKFMAELDTEHINLLVNAGLSRELVLHSITKASRVTFDNGLTLQYSNDPYDDAWDGANTDDAHRQCETEFNATAGPSQQWFNKPNDCNYQKFLFFLRAALQYGLTTEIRTDTPPPAKGAAPAKGAGKVTLCYDAAIAQQYNIRINAATRCGPRTALKSQTYNILSARIVNIEPKFRSPFGIFQYYGQLLATNSASRVRLIDSHTARMPTNDRRILTVENNGGRCFARAYHKDTVYCVPSDGANNTKQIFVLLNVLVNLSTKASQLQSTPTFSVAP